jgi:hypothetical protein
MAGPAALACCLVWDDLGQVRWAGLKHNYGTAEDVPGLLRACAGRDGR